MKSVEKLLKISNAISGNESVICEGVKPGAGTTNILIRGGYKAVFVVTYGGDLIATLALAWEAVLCMVIWKCGIPCGGRLVIEVEWASDGAAGLGSSALKTGQMEFSPSRESLRRRLTC